MSKNITYFLGAGASFHAYPILNTLCDKMIQMSDGNLNDIPTNIEKKPSNIMGIDEIFWDIRHFGLMGNKYGTIDTYAKKLYFNSDRELINLKSSINAFFTTWLLANDDKLKPPAKFENIDRRYISLLAAVLKKNKNDFPTLKPNMKFITWNYDLQLEYTYKAFCHEDLDITTLSNNLKFRVQPNANYDLDICHLNGYHGFYYTEENEHEFLERTNSKSVKEIVEAILFVTDGQKTNRLDLTKHINYAWENNDLANYTRDQAIKIFSQTDILVIIGYSFPPFNKEIDRLLFENLKDNGVTIYYQDPNASAVFIKQLVKNKDVEIICENKKLDNFILPYDF